MRDRIPSLDGLRGVAVLLVIWAHIPRGYLPSFVDAFSAKVVPGYMGVDIFFVLSGFLITRILLFDKARGKPLKKFFMRRFARIFPIYYLTLLVVGIADPGVWVAWWAAYLANFASMWGVAYTPMAHAWSLCVEEHFYLVWPLVVYWMRRTAAQHMSWLGLGLIGIGTSIVVMHTFPIGTAKYHVQFLTPTRILSLGAGALLAFREPYLRALGHRLVPRFLGLVVLGLGSLAWADTAVSEIWMPTVRLLGFAVFSTGVVLGCIWASTTTNRWEPLLANKPLSAVGKISYGLYLYHHPIMYFTLRTHEPGVRLEHPWLEIGGAIGLSFLVAWLSFRFIESPILQGRVPFTRPKSP